MSKQEKLLTRMRNNPHGIRPEEAAQLLCSYGFKYRKSGKNHDVYTKGSRSVIVNTHRPYLHARAVKDILEVIEEISEEE